MVKVDNLGKVNLGVFVSTVTTTKDSVPVAKPVQKNRKILGNFLHTTLQHGFTLEGYV